MTVDTDASAARSRTDKEDLRSNSAITLSGSDQLEELIGSPRNLSAHMMLTVRQLPLLCYHSLIGRVGGPTVSTKGLNQKVRRQLTPAGTPAAAAAAGVATAAARKKYFRRPTYFCARIN